MMNPKYTPLFQSYTLNNGITLKNRLVVAPMTHYASNPDGCLSEEETHFLEGRAENFGMFITAATLVSPEGKAFVGQPEAVNETHLESLKQVAKLIQNQGAKAILQIHHGGRLAQKALIGDHDIVVPFVNQAEKSDNDLHELTSLEIEKIIEAFANATDLAIRAGYDGVEIHGANNYLIQQFYSAKTNQRQDQWGGSLEKRMRFPLAIVDAVMAIKDAHKREDFIVGYRFSPEEPGDQGLTMVETFALVDALVEKPLQYLHISLWDFFKEARRGGEGSLTRMQLIHDRIAGKLPLIGVGNLFTAEDVIEAFETGWAEFIAVGKTVMINPNFATKIYEGREKEIETVIDPAQKEKYRIPSELWRQNLLGLSYLPPLKGDKNWQKVDI